MELTWYAQNNTKFLSNGSKLHFGFKLLYSTICDKRSELFNIFWPAAHSTGRKVSRGWTVWALAAYLGVGARLRLKSFFGLFVNKDVRLMAYVCLWMALSRFLAMSKCRLKLSPNMDLRCPRHGTRARFHICQSLFHVPNRVARRDNHS